MVITMSGQLKEMFVMMLLGIALSFLYDLIRVFRRALPHTLFYINAEDTVYWLFCAITSFMFILRLEYGQIRLFLLLGILVGVLMYYALISSFFMQISTVLIKAARAVISTVLYPFALTAQTFGTIFEYFVNFFKKLLKKCHKYGKIKLAFILKNLAVIFKKH